MLQTAPKKTKRQKKAALKAEEAHLYQTEQACLTESKEPEGPDDFDRLVLASPNDSALWVKYMSFFLHTTEVDKARSIAQRALKTIGFRYSYRIAQLLHKMCTNFKFVKALSHAHAHAGEKV